MRYMDWDVFDPRHASDYFGSPYDEATWVWHRRSGKYLLIDSDGQTLETATPAEYRRYYRQPSRLWLTCWTAAGNAVALVVPILLALKLTKQF